MCDNTFLMSDSSLYQQVNNNVLLILKKGELGGWVRNEKVERTTHELFWKLLLSHLISESTKRKLRSLPWISCGKMMPWFPWRPISLLFSIQKAVWHIKSNVGPDNTLKIVPALAPISWWPWLWGLMFESASRMWNWNLYILLLLCLIHWIDGHYWQRINWWTKDVMM